jgi:hypothetical protein
MVLVSLGSITIIAMMLWVLVCIIGLVTQVTHAKIGIAAAYAIGVLWSTGIIL